MSNKERSLRHGKPTKIKPTSNWNAKIPNKPTKYMYVIDPPRSEYSAERNYFLIFFTIQIKTSGLSAFPSCSAPTVRAHNSEHPTSPYTSDSGVPSANLQTLENSSGLPQSARAFFSSSSSLSSSSNIMAGINQTIGKLLPCFIY